MSGACCSPSSASLRAHAGLTSRSPRDAASLGIGAPQNVSRVTGEMVRLDGGVFQMGSEDEDGHPADGEGPIREVTLTSFEIDPTAVTVGQFAAFVSATGHVTEAERWGWSFVFRGLLPPLPDGRSRPTAPGTPWWIAVEGASWRSPEGAGSDVEDRADHPVVHVSWDDAAAYADWLGKRLPTEAEWEYAARGGLVGRRYAWGDELTPDGRWPCNIWQGRFPTENTLEDGFLATAPVRSYPPNGFGLYEMSGNVWEWCSDRWSTTWHLPDRPDTRVDPQGPVIGDARVIRGGSYLCHASYCNRYRVGARSSTPPDSSAGNLGFRCLR